MRNGLSIYQTKFCETTFRLITTLILHNILFVHKTTLLRQNSQQTHHYCRIATKLAKAYQYLLL